MTPQELKKARAELGKTQVGLAKIVDRCERWIALREQGAKKIDKQLEYSIKYLLSLAAK